MKPAVKFMILFVLLMLSFSMRGAVLNFIALGDKHSSEVYDGSSEVLESSNENASFSNISRAYDDAGTHMSSFSDIELGFRSVTESYSHSNSQRMRRAMELSDYFKNLAHELCLRENLLVLNKSMSYHSDKAPHSSQPSSDYYVFALRRIII